MDGTYSACTRSGSSPFQSEGDERVAEAKEARGYVKQCW